MQSYRGGDQSFHSYGGDVSAQPMVKKPLPALYKPPFFFANAASLVVCIIGIIFFFLAFGGPNWYEVPPEDTIVPKSFGLWRLCIRTECVVDMTNDYMVKRYLVFEDQEKRTTNPETIAAYEKFLVPVKVLMCIAVIFVFVTVATNLAFMAGLPTFFLEGGAQIFAGFLVSMAVGIFGGQFQTERHWAPFGWSYWCGVVAAIILLANGACILTLSIFVFRKRGGFFRKK